MLDTTLGQLQRHGVTELPDALLGDAGYWHTAQIQAISDRGIEVLIPPDGTMRAGKRPGWENGLYELMRHKLSSERGRKLYAQRKITVEPVYGQIRHDRRVDRFMRRGRAAAQSEWRLARRPRALTIARVASGSVLCQLAKFASVAGAVPAGRRSPNETRDAPVAAPQHFIQTAHRERAWTGCNNGGER